MMSVRDRAVRGFTVVELLILLLLVATVVLIGLPGLRKLVIKSRLEGVTRETAMVMRLARQEAIRGRIPVLVRPDYSSRQVVAFADVDRNGAFDPDPASSYRSTDYEVARLPLPSDDIHFMGPSGIPGSNSVPGDSVDGFEGTAGQALFEPDGSAREVGAFRFGDSRGNYLEVRVGPRATGRVEVRKYNGEPPGGLPSGWYAQATYQDQPLWVWYWEYKAGPFPTPAP